MLKILNCPPPNNNFFCSACVMKTDEGSFSSTEARTRFTFYGHTLCDCFNQAGPVSHSLFLSSSMLIFLVPISAGWSIPLTCFHCETFVVSNISVTQLAKNTWCLHRELCINCSTIVEFEQKVQHLIFITCSLTTCSFNRTAMTAACNSCRGIEECFIGANLHFPNTNTNLAECSLTGILDRPLHTICLHFRLFPYRNEVSSVSAYCSCN